MVDSGDWRAYPSFVRDNTLSSGVIYQDAMPQLQPPRLFDPVKLNASSQALQPQDRKVLCSLHSTVHPIP